MVYILLLKPDLDLVMFFKHVYPLPAPWFWNDVLNLDLGFEDDGQFLHSGPGELGHHRGSACLMVPSHSTANHWHLLRRVRVIGCYKSVYSCTFSFGFKPAWVWMQVAQGYRAVLYYHVVCLLRSLVPAWRALPSHASAEPLYDASPQSRATAIQRF